MTQVAFHLGVADKTLYTCRLVRKASRQGLRVRVVADDAELSALDSALWTFEALEFLPHLRLSSGDRPAQSWAHTPIWLTQAQTTWPDLLPAPQVIINLDMNASPEAQGAERIIELVSADPWEKEAARKRWRHYKSMGWECQHHEA